MSSLTLAEKKRLLTLLEKVSKEVNELKKKEVFAGKKVSLPKLKDHAELIRFYRRFVSPRKVVGKVVDKMKNKFYYETEYFLGEIIARQERFNNEVAGHLSAIEQDIEKIKKELSKGSKK